MYCSPPSRLGAQLSFPVVFALALLFSVPIWLEWIVRHLNRRRCSNTEVSETSKSTLPRSPIVRRVPRQSTGRIRKIQWTEVIVDENGTGYWTVSREVTAIFGENESMELMDSVCSICLVDYEDCEIVQRNYISGKAYTPCGHFFHKGCIGAWLDTGRRECPCCRSAFVVHALVEI
jgi:Ring finger domain